VLRMGHTEEKVIHWVNDDLFDHIEVRKTGEFADLTCRFWVKLMSFK